MLVKRSNVDQENGNWKIIFVADQLNPKDPLIQQIEALEFNFMKCRVLLASSCEQAIDLLNQNHCCPVKI